MNDSIKKEADKILKAKNPNIFGLRKDNFIYELLFMKELEL